MTKLYNPNQPLLIEGDNLSCAWAKAALHVLDHPGHEVCPLTLTFKGIGSDGKIEEVPLIRNMLNKLLIDKGNWGIDVVANTIFPQHIWQIAQGDRHRLYNLYLKTFERYKAVKPKENRSGSYFERLISYGRGPLNGNQLEWIIQERQSGSVRRSKLQASIFDPERDHSKIAQLRFPCMQQISFNVVKNELILNAFYATQQLFVKAYGNYLGLAQLGVFMAHELGMPLAQVNVYVGIAKFQKINKTDPELKPLLDAARSCVTCA